MKSFGDPRTFLAVPGFLWCNCSTICGLSAQRLCGGINGDLLIEGLSHRLCDQVSCTHSPCHWGRPLLTCTFTWETLNTVLAQSLWSPWVLVHTRFCLIPSSVSGRYGVWFQMWFRHSYHLAGASPLPLDTGYLFFGRIQHSPLDGCSAVSSNFEVLARKVEHRSFYSAILIA